ncbi:MAG: PQQ-binding-like beta-propeller repeat protein [Ginsengibacter sp.]
MIRKITNSKITICFALLVLLFSCNNNTVTSQASKVDHSTLVVSSAGNLYNYNLDEKKVSWEYTGKFDTDGNRNYFAIDGEQIFMPYESGKFISFNVNTGKILWQQEIFGKENDVMEMSSGEDDQAEMLNELKPLFMTTPLVDGDNVLINSTGRPNQSMGYLYNFNKTTGKRLWAQELPTVFNYFAPVKYIDNYFVNSAVYLEMFTPKTGTSTSYGMFDGDAEIAGEPVQNNPPNQFASPIYSQMQTDGKSIFIGDENGKFYCFQLDKNGSVPGGDITDPKNTFINNPKIFKWIFSDEEYSFQKNNITFLTKDALFVEMKTGSADKSCIFALNPGDGKVIWKKVVAGDINNWALHGDKIAGSTDDLLFWMEANGQNYAEVKIDSKPLSNMEWTDNNHLIYITKKGIENIDIGNKKSTLIFSKDVQENEHNNVQIKFLGK